MLLPVTTYMSNKFSDACYFVLPIQLYFDLNITTYYLLTLRCIHDNFIH